MVNSGICPVLVCVVICLSVQKNEKILKLIQLVEICVVVNLEVIKFCDI